MPRVCLAISSSSHILLLYSEIPGVFGIGAIGGTHPIQGKGGK